MLDGTGFCRYQSARRFGDRCQRAKRSAALGSARSAFRIAILPGANEIARKLTPTSCWDLHSQYRVVKLRHNHRSQMIHNPNAIWQKRFSRNAE